MKRNLTVMMICLGCIMFAAGIAVAVDNVSPSTTPAADKPVQKVEQIAVLNVISTSMEMDAGKLSILTDVFRTEIFKLNIFKVLDRSYIEKILNEQKLTLTGVAQEANLTKIGQLLSAEKLFVCTLEKFGNTIAVNVRIINVETSLMDYTENVFVKDESMIFDALKEIVRNIEMHYMVKGDIEDITDYQATKWKFLGANEIDTKYLATNNIGPEKYLELRQYDITFTVNEFIDAVRKSWDLETIKMFLRNGVTYANIKKALGFGIVNLDNYTRNFRPAGLRFEEYLDAYAKNMLTPEDYMEYKLGYRRDDLSWGVGGVANMIPIVNADFKFLLGSLTWEHYFTEYQRGSSKSSIDAGAYLFNGFAPVPYLQYNWYFGKYPFYFKTGVGSIIEVLLGGHLSAYVHVGIEVKEKYEFSIMVAPVGTQPGVSYTDLRTKRDDPKFVGITYPYFAVLFKFK